ncbi:MAG: hypothetical protein NDI90_11220 [Nitrospira sp. BO4]|nr:hypothetical protein [Nitrospira sp. BO4]
MKLIEETISTFFDSNPYPIVTERDPEDGVYHARLVYPQKLPYRQISLMIGDCVHNMRAALDYIAWELAGANMDDTVTMFPIFDTDTEFAKSAGRRIKNVSPEDARTLIERLQPYSRRYGGHLLALSAINKLDISDKHKVLTVAIAVAQRLSCTHHVARRDSVTAKTYLLHYPGARLVHDAIIATFTVRPPIQEMEVNFKFTPEVEFANIHGFPAHAFVVPNLKKMMSSVDQVINRFRKFFPGYTEKE